jgi:hypothetical protein
MKRLTLLMLVFAILVFLPFLIIAETKTIVRAVYRGGLELHEEPAGTILADPSVCLPTDKGAEHYDYSGQLAKTVEKANTRIHALILDEKIATYTGSVALIDRNLALIAGAIKRLKKLDGLTGYLLPLGTVTHESYPGATFQGKCYRASHTESFGHPDALGELNPTFGSANRYVEFSPAIDVMLTKEIPELLTEFVKLEANKMLTKKQKEEETGKLGEKVMAKVGFFMAIDEVTAAELMPREFGKRGTRLATTPTISMVKSDEKCTLSTPFAITVNALSVSHTFKKCLPEIIAVPMLKDKLEEKQKLLQKARIDFVRLLSAAGKERAQLEKQKPQYFGD